ncbi:phage head-tail connector protein [Bacillus norwichensis]|uniref:Phage head-tail connector protein n=1 Tax=Bacillus norwichensis TaxID=2762217 RepID=A0ABR8VP79_9BACI|nr:phage head-tail connector protein [Bacillus norwichensis]MBD8006543.1 phage head-tail connector protein [Bacillus norwichensis]
MPFIENIKLILDIDDNSKDAILYLYLDRAENFVKDYCNIDELNLSLEETVEDIAIFHYRNRGVENMSSERKGNLSESYRDGLPSEIYKKLNEHRRMKFI